MEGGLLDRAAPHADALALAHGPAHRAAAARMEALDARLAGSSIGELPGALAAARQPCVLARAGECDIGHFGGRRPVVLTVEGACVTLA